MAYTEAVKRVLERQITSPEDAVGKTVKKLEFDDGLNIIFEDGSCMLIDADVYEEFEASVVISRRPVHARVLSRAGLLTKRQFDVEMNAAHRKEDIKRKKKRRAEYERLKKEFEGEANNAS